MLLALCSTCNKSSIFFGLVNRMIIEYFSIIYDRKKPQKAILEASRESKTYNEYRTLNDESAIVKLLFFFIHGNLKELYII